MAAVKVTTDTFQQEVLDVKGPVLVDFWAEWCGPCQMILPVIEELSEELEDVKVCKVNVDEQMELARKYRVMSIPTIMIFRDGEMVKREQGARSKAELLAMLDR